MGNKKNILIFAKDCPINDECGAGIYLRTLVYFLDKYYDVVIHILIGRYNKLKRYNHFIISPSKNIFIYHADKLCKEYKLPPLRWCSFKKRSIAEVVLFSKTSSYRFGQNYISWFILINHIIKVKNIDLTIIRDHQFLSYYPLYVNKKIISSIPNLYSILIPPVDFKDEYGHLKENNKLWTTVLITPNDLLYKPNFIYIPPMITNNVIRKPSYEKKNIISFIGTLTDNQHLREIAKAFNNSLKKKVLPSDYILNITGKCCLSKQYSKALYNEIQGYNMIKKNIILNLNINGIASDILETIIKDSLICIRIDINREVLSTKVLHYIDLCKPIILQKLNVHTYFLGDNYPFYINKNLDNSVNEIEDIFSKLNETNLKKAYDKICEAKLKVNDRYLYDNNPKLKSILNSKKIISIVGTRPQFLKVAPLCYEFKNTMHEHSIIHTGQHYDKELSEQLFKTLNIPEPQYHLKRDHSSSIHFFTSLMNELERILTIEKPDYIIVYGDCDTTFAGAFVAQKLGIQLIHIEAGMRSYNKAMPEEINRILTDNISNILLCTTKDSVENLEKENITNNVSLVGNLQLDLLKLTIEKNMSTVPSFDFEIKNYVLLTIHRNYNTTPEALTKIFKSLYLLKTNIIFPIHPRTKKIVNTNTLVVPANIKLVKPVSYFEMVHLLQNSNYVITDSGGLQPECWFLNKRCIVLRTETEWTEPIKSGNSILYDVEKPLAQFIQSFLKNNCEACSYNMNASKNIINIIDNINSL